MDPCQVRTAGICGAAPAEPGRYTSGGRHGSMAAVSSDGARPPPAAPASCPQHQGADQPTATDRGQLLCAATDVLARRLPAWRRGDGAAADLGGCGLFGVSLSEQQQQGLFLPDLSSPSAERVCMLRQSALLYRGVVYFIPVSGLEQTNCFSLSFGICRNNRNNRYQENLLKSIHSFIQLCLNTCFLLKSAGIGSRS